MRKAIFENFDPIFAAAAALAIAALFPLASQSSEAHGGERHVYGPHHERLELLPDNHPLRQAREALIAKLPVISLSKGTKAGASGGNVVCRLVGQHPNFRFECDNSDALFNKGATDSRTWATIDLVIWMRDSWVNSHGGEASARARLRAAFGHANRIFAQSDTSIQLRAAEVIRLPDNAVDFEGMFLLPARYGTDFATVLADVSDPLNIRECTINSCSYGQQNGAANRSYAGHLGAWDHSSAWNVVIDLAGELGSLTPTGERINQVLSDLGGSIAHELSHGMGGDHAVPLVGTHLPYGKGYIIPWRTPEEAIANAYCGDANTGGAGTFSNPRHQCSGRSKGIENEADAARAFKESRFEFASFSRVSKRTPGNFTGLWWTPIENGVGWTFTHQDDILFGVWYTYDFGGQPLWLVASDLRRQLDDSFQGSLYRVKKGIPIHAVNGLPAVNPSDLEDIGALTVSFNDSDWGQASFALTIDGKTYRDSKWLTRLNFQANPPTCVATSATRISATNYQDLWWNPAESGWGMHISHEGHIIFATWYIYNDVEKPLWRVASSMQRQSDGSFSGAIYALTGVPLDAIGGKLHEKPWVGDSNYYSAIGRDAGHFPPQVAGTARLVFRDGEHGTLYYTADGHTTMKSIVRMVIAATSPLCE